MIEQEYWSEKEKSSSAPSQPDKMVEALFPIAFMKF
jgi:hypothetical protein